MYARAHEYHQENPSNESDLSKGKERRSVEGLAVHAHPTPTRPSDPRPPAAQFRQTRRTRSRRGNGSPHRPRAAASIGSKSSPPQRVPTSNPRQRLTTKPNATEGLNASASPHAPGRGISRTPNSTSSSHAPTPTNQQRHNSEPCGAFSGRSQTLRTGGAKIENRQLDSQTRVWSFPFRPTSGKAHIPTHNA